MTTYTINSAKGLKGRYFKEEKYWQHKLSGGSKMSFFPHDYYGGHEYESNKRECTEFIFPVGVSNQFRVISNESEIGIFFILLTGLIFLLHRYTGEEDIIIGAPGLELDNTGTAIEKILLLRNFVEKEMTFKDLVLQVKTTISEAEEYTSFYPFHEIIKLLNKSGLRKNDNVLDTIIVFENIHGKNVPEKRRSDTFFAFKMNDGQIRGQIGYNPALYEKRTIISISRHFIKYFEEITSDSKIKLSEIEILSDTEKQGILFQFNDTETSYPGDMTIPGLFADQVERTPGNIAVVCEGQHLTYKELDKRTGRLALVLRERQGIEPVGIVGIMVDRSIDMVTGIFGILKSGSAYLPIAPEYPDKRVRYMLKDSTAGLLLTGEQYAGRFTAQFKILDLNDPDSYIGAPSEISKSRISPGNPAYVMYTSGSTGHPKAVVIEQRSIMNTLFALQGKYPLLHSDTYLLKTPYVFDVSAAELFGWFFAGGKLAILEKGGEKDPYKMLDAVEKFDISHMNLIPSMFNAFMDFLVEENPGRIRNIKYIFLAGEALYPAVVKKFRRFLSGSDTGLRYTGEVRLENIYGPTEASIYGSWYSLSGWNEGRSVPIGNALNNVRLYILDKLGYAQPVGVAGELYIGGRGLARGYLNKVELTANRFTTNPYIPDERLYRTGDMVKWLENGEIEFLGRVDFQVKVRGNRVELGEIESKLINHTHIIDTVVLAREDNPGENYLCAYIVSRPELSLSELRKYLQDSLPGYMIPSFFIKVEAIPLTPNGKVNRSALPLPQIEAQDEYTAPRDAVERKLVDIWSEVLGMEKDKISIDTNFFALGGNSLKATFISAKIHKESNVEIPIKEIFKLGTIREIAVLISAAVLVNNPGENGEYEEITL